MVKAEKNFDAGIRILEILKILLNKELSRRELIAELKERGHSYEVYTPEAFLKYFNTFQALGIGLKRRGNRYYFKNALFKLNLSKEEENVLILILNNYKNLHNKESKDILEHIVHKINKYVDFDVDGLFDKIVYNNEQVKSKNIQDNVLQTLENMLSENQYVQLIYKITNSIIDEQTVELKQISEKNGRYYIVCYIPQIAKNKRIYIDKIVKMEQLPKKKLDINYLNAVVFEIRGRLASIYKLKESESVIDFSPNHITISNTAEDKDTLLLRLLKYGEFCKIVKPEYVKKEFISLTHRMLKNLES